MPLSESLRPPQRHTAYIERVVEPYIRQTGNSIYDPYSPLNPSIVAIPVSSQEHDYIENTLNQYARQSQLHEPLSIVMNVNATQESEPQALTRTIDAIQRASGNHPALDVRWFETEYEDDVTIGKIRNELFKTILHATHLQQSNPMPQDTLVYNHDADLVSMPHDYLATVQRAVRSTELARQQRVDNYHPSLGTVALPVFGTRLDIESPPALPNISRLMTWANYTNLAPRKIPEPTLILPSATYIYAGGFDESNSIKETSPLAAIGDNPRYIATRGLVSSARRAVFRLSEADDTLASLYASTSFLANDPCRSLASAVDITYQKAQDEATTHADIFSTALRNIGEHRARLRFHAAGCTWKPEQFVDEKNQSISRAMRAANRVLKMTFDEGHPLYYKNSAGVIELAGR